MLNFGRPTVKCTPEHERFNMLGRRPLRAGYREAGTRRTHHSSPLFATAHPPLQRWLRLFSIVVSKQTILPTTPSTTAGYRPCGIALQFAVGLPAVGHTQRCPESGELFGCPIRSLNSSLVNQPGTSSLPGGAVGSTFPAGPLNLHH